MARKCLNKATRHRQNIQTLYRYWAIMQELQVFRKYEEKNKLIIMNFIQKCVCACVFFKLVLSPMHKTQFSSLLDTRFITMDVKSSKCSFFWGRASHTHTHCLPVDEESFHSSCLQSRARLCLPPLTHRNSWPTTITTNEKHPPLPRGTLSMPDPLPTQNSPKIPKWCL